ncbi:Aureobasidin resistance protein Aur1 [Thoreauomyces humboldtii]|nr:Aureobasidin resistance protein Aur1 [Thoreauomyces humboldtii]
MPAPTYLRKLCFLRPRGCFHSTDGVCSPLCRFLKQAILAALPIAIWLVLFTCAQFIPSSWRPVISVDVLPALDELLFDNSLGLLSFCFILVASGWLVSGSHLSTLLVFIPLVLRGLRDLAAVTSTAGDVLAFIPYGFLHYISPAIFVLWLWYHAGVKTAIVFAQAFGVQNILGVVTQVLCPTAAPWYNDLYGFAPANYTMPGNPGGLARVDKLFGTHMYSNAFNNSPLVFGAMPSLHSGFAVLIMIFAMHFSRRLGSVFMFYVCWQWWATMYLRHHYMADLVVGALYSTVIYMFSRRHLARASSLGWVHSSGSEYKLLDVVVLDDVNMLSSGKSECSVREQSGMWNEAILKSRRTGERDSLSMVVPMESVLVEDGQ